MSDKCPLCQTTSDFHHQGSHEFAKQLEPTPEAAGSDLEDLKKRHEGLLKYVEGQEVDIEGYKELNERLRKQVEVASQFLESAIGEGFGFCRTDASGNCGCKWHQELESCLAKLKGDQP